MPFFNAVSAVENLAEDLKQKGFRIDMDLSSEPISGKIKQAEIEKIPYIIVIGDKEEAENTIAVRKNSIVVQMRKFDFLSQIRKEIAEKI